MGSTLETVVFYFLAAFIIAMSIMTVTTQRIVRSATYLLFVLFGTAGIYFLLGYTFLGSVQIMVYAGGIVVLYVFSIILILYDYSKWKPGCAVLPFKSGSRKRHNMPLTIGLP